jgi:hypothetical protein
MRKVVWAGIASAVAFFYSYLMLFSLSCIPLFRTGDESFFWTYGWRMLHGQVFLRDFHQFTPPGTDLVYETVFRLFGSGMQSINWTLVGLGVALTVVCFFAALQVVRVELAALAAVLCFLFLYADRFDGTHHWFSSLANLLAVIVLSKASAFRRIAAAGFLLAVAAFFTQTAGVMGLLACSGGLLWERRATQCAWSLALKRVGLLWSTTLGVWLLFAGEFIWRAGLVNTWRAQVAYLPKDANFPSGFLLFPFSRPVNLHGWISGGDHLIVYLVILFVCPYVLGLCMRRKAVILENPVPVVFLSALGIGQTLEVITMLNANRMAAVAMPGVILFVWSIRRSKVIPVAAWCLTGVLMMGQAAATQLHQYVLIKLPTGEVKFQASDAEEVGWLVAHTRPGDSFFEVANTRFYAPLELRNPTPVDVLGLTDITLPGWVDEVMEGLDKSRTQYVVWKSQTGNWAISGGAYGPNDHLEPLRRYMREHYARVIVFGNGEEIWERDGRTDHPQERQYSGSDI